ncbi:hypothetical protein GCM10010423_70320 [Streptomyces levis]|uniref:Uncharacterized protein n=1 Tax=Streptomyces levis TaxID=285566 RepID=A0ABN3P536_9ACTN
MGYWRATESRPSKVMSKAFSAVFQRMVQRACPLPVGSRDMIRHVDALQSGLLVGEVTAGLDRPPDPCVHRLDRIGRADDAADLGVEPQERGELLPRVLPQFTIAGYLRPQASANSANLSRAASSVGAV